MLLAERQVKPFNDSEFVYEIKYDGYRVLAEFGPAGARLKSRNGADASSWFPEVVHSLAAFGAARGRTVVDGEMCVLDKRGRSDFDKLHARALRRRRDAGDPPAVYCVFDILVLDGVNVMHLPLLQRKQLLVDLFEDRPPALLVVTYLEDVGLELYQAVLQLSLEGLVAKRATSVYTAGMRTNDWLKVKRPGAVPAKRFSRGTAPDPFDDPA
jgi:bifunctional non-homologous end joining protein LigD